MAEWLRQGEPPVKGKRTADPSDVATVKQLDEAIDYIKAEMEAAPGLESPAAATALMTKAIARQTLLHAELELHSAIQEPAEAEVAPLAPFLRRLALLIARVAVD